MRLISEKYLRRKKRRLKNGAFLRLFLHQKTD